MKQIISLSLLIYTFMICGFVYAAESTATTTTTATTEKAKTEKELPKEESVPTEHKVQINGREIPYKAVAGTLPLKDEQGNIKAGIFYISYTRTDVKNPIDRPITFCFNGGPGSSSVWLHMGIFGPKRVQLTDDGFAEPPYRYIDNEFSILESTDLVFIDPVSTGYSRAAPGEDVKQFYGVDEDVKWVAEFIRLYTTRVNRWDSPKFLAGESYGTTRAAALAGYLHDEFNMYFNGVILISSVLDFQTYDNLERGNDLPYITYLPSYTAAAWYHQKLSPELQQQDLQKLLQEVQEFSINEYSLVLLKGDKLSPEKKAETVEKLAKYTGLSQNYLARSDMRVNIMRFTKELLRKKDRTIGRFDSRYTGIDFDKYAPHFEYDPSADAIFGAFTATFNQYVRTDLKWEKDDLYRIIADVRPWSYGKATNKYLNVAGTLRDVMTRNPDLQVFVGSGYFDLATPYFSSEYTFNHMNLDPTIANHIRMEYYDAGHMMYIHKPSLVKMSKDLADYYKQTLKK